MICVMTPLFPLDYGAGGGFGEKYHVLVLRLGQGQSTPLREITKPYQSNGVRSQIAQFGILSPARGAP